MSALPDVLSRGLQYFSLPFLFPQHALRLSWLTLSNRRLVGELARLWPQRKWFETTDAKTVIDVGSYIGAFAYAINVLIPEAQIYCFEPLPENYEQLLHTWATFSDCAPFALPWATNRVRWIFGEAIFPPLLRFCRWANCTNALFPIPPRVPVSRCRWRAWMTTCRR